MYTYNVSSTPEVAVQTSPLGAAPYSATPNCVRYGFAGAWGGNDAGDYGWKGINVYYPTFAGTFNTNKIWNNRYGNNPADAGRPTGSIASYAHTGDPVTGNPWLLADTTYQWVSDAFGSAGNFGWTSAPWSLKTIAKPLATGPYLLDDPQKTSIRVTAQWYPNTNESTGTLVLYYKKASDMVWSQWSVMSPALNGYSITGYTTVVTGLTPGTTYQFKASVTRTVAPVEAATEWSLGSLATLQAAPTVTTNPATGVTPTSAFLNATVDPNLTDCYAYFEWGLTAGYGNTTNFPSTYTTLDDGDRAVSKQITGLSNPGVTYHFRAVVSYVTGAGTVYVYGSDATLVTTVDPVTSAKQEDLMQTLQFDGQYNQAKTISFTLKTVALAGSDYYYTGTAPTTHSSTANLKDIYVYKDGGAGAVSANGAARIGSSKVYTLQLTAGEMSAEVIDIVISTANSAARDYRDQHIQIRTAQRLSELDVDASQMSGNVNGITAIGVGSGAGIYAQAGATGADIDAVLASNWLRVGTCYNAPSSADYIKLDSGADTADEFYTGCLVAIIGGMGAGQARIAISYVGGAAGVNSAATTKQIKVDTPWSTSPDSTSVFALSPGPRTWEMAAPNTPLTLPTSTGKYGDFLRLLFQRFAFRITQDAQYQSWYNEAGDAVQFSREVYDDGSLQELKKLA